MSTRALYTFLPSDGHDQAWNVYKHHDGYPKGAAIVIQQALDWFAMRSKLQERWSEYHLAPSDRPKIKYEYFVSGRGDFPFDMLRHDGAWPATGEDAARLFYLDGRREVRSVRMRSYQKPTIDRWSSFGWSVGTQDLHSKEERFIDGLIP